MTATRRTVISCFAVVALMTGLSFAAVPLYDLFCRVTGFGGTVQQFEQCPAEINKSIMVEMHGLCKGNEVKAVFAKAKTFQRDAVKDWNPYADRVTKSLCLGLVGVDEKDAEDFSTFLFEK